jgi:hypothetical protein
MDIPKATKRGPMNFCQTDWSAMTELEQIKSLDVEGFVVLPGLLDHDTMSRIKAECADLPMNTAPYSNEQTFAAVPPQWHSKTYAEVIGHPRMTEFLKKAIGEDLVFMLGQYICSGYGVPGLALHSDYQPYGSAAKGWNESSPATVRVLIYLDDLTPDRAPFTIVPRSHLSIHQESDPYRRFDNHPDMVTVCLKAGDAIAFNVKAFHGTHPSTANFRRTMLEYAYRPLWARCVGPVEEWDPKDVAHAPSQAKPFLRPRNSGLGENLQPINLGNASQALADALSPKRSY